MFDTIAKVVRNMLHDFRAQQITTLAQAYAKANVHHDKLFASISGTVVARVSEFKQADIQELLKAYETLGISSADISRALDAKHSKEPESSHMVWLLISLLLIALITLILQWQLS